VLQLRAELMRASDRKSEHECTSFAVVGSASRDGGTIAGQNADLPAMYRDLLVLVRRHGDGDRPRLATLTPAGQIGYHGMNEAGVAVFANFLYSGGWRVGVPRYLLTRVALAQPDRESAAAAVERTPRASSRNLMIADTSGAVDVETATTASARLEPENGLLAHANHHVAPALEPLEQADETGLRNSRRRLERMQTLLEADRGQIDVPAMARVLRDRDGVPDALCRASGEWPDEVITIASTIAEVEARRLWIAIGPPHLAAYHPYQV
jgi:isopenicillin-N N-acyltransferase like protein